MSTATPKNSTSPFDLDLHHYLGLKEGNWSQTVKSNHVQSLFDLDLWPTTLTYIASLAKVKVDLHTKDEGRRSNGLAGRVGTDRWMDRQADGCYQVYYLPATRCFAVYKNQKNQGSGHLGQLNNSTMRDTQTNRQTDATKCILLIFRGR